MSEAPPSPPTVAEAPAPVAPTASGPACPLARDVLTANFRKPVDPAAPAPLRMMGAKGLVPMAPKEVATALFMLTFDADAAIRVDRDGLPARLPRRIPYVPLRTRR